MTSSALISHNHYSAHHHHITTLPELVELYNSTLENLLETHAPLIHKTITIRPDSPWYTKDIDLSKRKKRKLEKKWRQAKRNRDEKETQYRTEYQQQCHTYYNLIKDCKRSYYNRIIDENGTDQRKLFSIINKLLNRKYEPKYPQHNCLKDLTEAFSEYFISEIKTIRADMANDHLEEEHKGNTLLHVLDTFQEASSKRCQ